MTKTEALALLGTSSYREASRLLGITYQAVRQWPDEGDLPIVTEGRVLVFLSRREQLALPAKPRTKRKERASAELRTQAEADALIKTLRERLGPSNRRER